MTRLKTGQKIYIIYDGLEIEEVRIVKPAGMLFDLHKIKKRYQRGVDFIHRENEGDIFFLTLEEAKNKLSRNKVKLIKNLKICIESLESDLSRYKNKLKSLEADFINNKEEK